MKKLREQLGLNQSEMAKLLGSSKATGSLYEKGARELNAKSLNMLTTIEFLLQNPAEICVTDKIRLNEQKALVAMLKKLAYEQKRAEHKHELVHEKLLRMQEVYACNQKLWRLLNELKTNLKGPGANPFIGVLEVRCLDKLKACGLDQQVALHHQLAILDAEMASAKQIIEEYEGFGLPDWGKDELT
ncbi:helix-turn-helix domain-containing protein [Pedobacter endophyticus]|uniref:Helix-turn-helix domain-containing protein n=1 Tax=Pedobacter endophyticus TaxID=2789740 RepID=A0A7S9L1Q7_9SPHI|nr:helix-turn-helix domain-containing protein [Pedobacter endophyticus]QPH40892.1 helix-turn-helix domain-containing protein [Pedobacter endophyticus]